MNFYEIAKQQGWTPETQVEVLLQFVDTAGSCDFDGWLTNFIDEENEMHEGIENEQ